MRQVFEHYLLLKEQEKKLKKEILDTECKIYSEFQEKFDSKESGTVNVESDGFKVSVVKRENVKVNQDLASVVEIGFKKNYELNKTAYKLLSKEDQKRVDECLTTSIGKPSFKIERIEDGY